MLSNIKLVSILLVEDDPDDIAITKRAFKKGNIVNPLFVVRDGEEAIEYLKNTGKYTDVKEAPRPGIILLDLNMPRMDGREVLEQVKSDESLRRIPIIVLTTSKHEGDIFTSYDSGANTYITKPVNFKEFLDALQALGKYWLSIAELSQN